MDYAKTIESAQQRLKELMAQREILDREILALTKIIDGAQLGAETPSQWNPDDPKFVAPAKSETEPTGFTDKVRLIMRTSPTPLLPTEIRDRLEDIGVEGTSPKGLLIHVHKVIERFLKSGEIMPIARDGKTAYKILSPMEQAMRHYADTVGSVIRKDKK